MKYLAHITIGAIVDADDVQQAQERITSARFVSLEVLQLPYLRIIEGGCELKEIAVQHQTVEVPRGLRI